VAPSTPNEYSRNMLVQATTSAVRKLMRGRLKWIACKKQSHDQMIAIYDKMVNDPTFKFPRDENGELIQEPDGIDWPESCSFWQSDAVVLVDRLKELDFPQEAAALRHAIEDFPISQLESMEELLAEAERIEALLPILRD